MLKIQSSVIYAGKNVYKIASSGPTSCAPDPERGLEPAQLFPLRLRPVQGLRRGRVGGHQVGQNHQGMCLSRPYRLSMALSCELIINLQIIRNFRASRVQWDQYYEPDLAVMQLQLKICQFLMRYFGRC